MPKPLDSERALFDELISRVQIVLGRVAALRCQLDGIAAELREIESGADELLHRLAQAQHGLRGTGGAVSDALSDEEGPTSCP